MSGGKRKYRDVSRNSDSGNTVTRLKHCPEMFVINFLTIFLLQSELCAENSGLDCASADAAAATATANATDSPGASAEDSGVKDSGKKKKNRCLECKKKVGLTGKGESG